MPNLLEESRKAIKNDPALFNLLQAAKHTLGSYIYGNKDPHLAEEVKTEIENALKQSR
ncbi:MAG: hypothetical protein M0R74_13895 [Dehalococcoidia bacterium]|jgi:hypothetical protein|nr:hypothetical protein [Dehalococcoidia bacterium]